MAIGKIIGTPSGEMDIKRLSLPGVRIIDKCPKCSVKVTRDFGRGHYLSYPTMNEAFDFGMYHDCGGGKSAEWSVRVMLEVKLMLIATTIEEETA